MSGTVSSAPSWQWIDAQRVMSYVKQGSALWIIDVRSATAYEKVHIEGSVNIPSGALMHKNFPAQKMLVLVDDSLGQKSAREAAQMLVKKGNERVSVLEGGMSAWKSDGLPIIGSNEQDRGVTAAELKWALANSVPMKIYDLRDPKMLKQGAVQNSEAVPGKTVAERVETLKKTVNAGKKKDLAALMKKPEPVVLIFAASDDAEGNTRKLMQGSNVDIRYLIGGYEATIADKLRGQQTTGTCPTCPGGK